MSDPSTVRQRTSPRLRWSLPVLLDWEQTIYTGTTEDLSAEGARVKVPVAFPTGALLEITNLQSGHRARFRVVWGHDPLDDDSFKMGVRMVKPADAFWGFDWASGARPPGGKRLPEPLATQTLSWRNRRS